MPIAGIEARRARVAGAQSSWEGSWRKIKSESRRERKAKARRELERRVRAKINDPARSGAEANELIDDLRAASAQAIRDLMKPVVRARGP